MGVFFRSPLSSREMGSNEVGAHFLEGGRTGCFLLENCFPLGFLIISFRWSSRIGRFRVYLSARQVGPNGMELWIGLFLPAMDCIACVCDRLGLTFLQAAFHVYTLRSASFPHIPSCIAQNIRSKWANDTRGVRLDGLLSKG